MDVEGRQELDFFRFRSSCDQGSCRLGSEGIPNLGITTYSESSDHVEDLKIVSLKGLEIWESTLLKLDT